MYSSETVAISPPDFPPPSAGRVESGSSGVRRGSHGCWLPDPQWAGQSYGVSGESEVVWKKEERLNLHLRDSRVFKVHTNFETASSIVELLMVSLVVHGFGGPTVPGGREKGPSNDVHVYARRHIVSYLDKCVSYR